MRVGCLDRIFAVELDLEQFRELEATRRGFGALRAVRPPRAICMTQVDPAFPHRLPGRCANPQMGALVAVGAAGAEGSEDVGTGWRAG